MFRWVIIFCLLSSSYCALASAEEIRVQGCGAATSSYFSPYKEPFEDATGDVLLIKQSTPVDGLIALEQGLADVATAVVPLTTLLEGAERKGVTIDPATLKWTAVGESKTLVFVHKDISVTSLSKEQLKGIFTGKISTWKEVGAEDLPIDVIWCGNTPGQNALFSNAVLDGEEVTDKNTPAIDYDDIRLKVIKRHGAIGIDPEGYKTGAIKIPKTPLVASQIIVITKGEPSGKAKKVLDFIKSAKI